MAFEWAFFVVLLGFCFLCAPLLVWAPCVVSGLAARCARHPLRMICLVRSGRSVCRWAAARPRAVCAACCCLWPRWCSGRRRPALKGRAAVCAGGRRPAREIATREPDGSEWSISRPALALPPPTDTAAWPTPPPSPRTPSPYWDPAPHAPIPAPTPNFARNSPTAASSFELRSLELQRFQTLLKLLPIELHATFLERRH